MAVTNYEEGEIAISLGGKEFIGKLTLRALRILETKLDTTMHLLSIGSIEKGITLDQAIAIIWASINGYTHANPGSQEGIEFADLERLAESEETTEGENLFATSDVLRGKAIELFLARSLPPKIREGAIKLQLANMKTLRTAIVSDWKAGQSITIVASESSDSPQESSGSQHLENSVGDSKETKRTGKRRNARARTS